jgi:DNA-binding transcriptional LysR family regulator
MDKLKTIETFVRIARTLSVSNAARSLGITRGLASVHLKHLEDRLGARLVNRTTRQLSLTEVGQDYFQFCVRILESFEEKDAELSQIQKVPQGHLRILASSAFAEFVLAPVVARFASSYREIQVSLLVVTQPTFSRELVEKGFDVGITMHLVEEASIVVSRLGRVPWLPYASLDYLEEHGAPLVPDDLQDHDCICHQSISPDGVWRFEGEGQSGEVRVKGQLSTNNVMILRQFVATGMGIGLLPTYSLNTEFRRTDIVRVLNKYNFVSRDIYAAYSSSKHLSKKVRIFLDYLREELNGHLSVS